MQPWSLVSCKEKLFSHFNNWVLIKNIQQKSKIKYSLHAGVIQPLYNSYTTLSLHNKKRKKWGF